MADPRTAGPQARRDTRSALMREKALAATGEVVNFCPYGCDTTALDERGYCFHLVGFTTNGRVMEPRVVRKDDGRIIVDGKKPQKLKAGDLLVKITTTARVYRAGGNPALVRKDDELDTNPDFLDPEELALQRALHDLQHPMLDGEVKVRTSYDDDDDELEAATRPAAPVTP